MSHGHPHPHHHHDETPATGAEVPPALDQRIPDSELSPGDVSRRGFLRGAGVLGAGAAVAAAGAFALPEVAMADDGRSGARRQRGYRWLAGDHHIYSPDAVYRVIDHVQHANAYGLDWMVITDHGSVQHAKIGVAKVNPDIRAARDVVRDTLVFQGLEWNIPAAEHGTVFVHPGPNEVAVLKEFENAFDGAVTNTSTPTPANEALAIAGVNFLASAVGQKRVRDALFLANHPARKGIDSPHEIRGWRDAQPSIAIGFEGAPGHQAAGLPAPAGPGSGRGFYDNAPSPASFPQYPLESYRTWGGFDWMAATVGGLWDSLLAEGKPWWITANSDSHFVHLDGTDRGPGSDFNTNGCYNDPVYAAKPGNTNGDYWPGFYSRTHVGATEFSYAAVMAGMRAGRIWVDHGGLVGDLDVRVESNEKWAPLGGSLVVKRGRSARLVIEVDGATRPNWAQFVPHLDRVDVIKGLVTGPVSDRDTFTAPATKLAQSYQVTGNRGRFVYDLGVVEQPFYVRLRGTDGNRKQGGTLDPLGPAIDVVGAADPWTDLWFYTNPIWVLPAR